jgi:DNA-binding transcriptional regulator YiaG
MSRVRELTDVDVLKIRTTEGVTLKQWADQLHVSIQTVFKAKHGKGAYAKVANKHND